MTEELNYFDNKDLENLESLGCDELTLLLENNIKYRALILGRFKKLTEILRNKAHKQGVCVDLYNMALSQLYIDELAHVDTVYLAKLNRKPIIQADSFFRSIVLRRRKKQLGLLPDNYIGITKSNDRLLANILGIKTPKLLFNGAFSDIPVDLRVNVVIKPQKSSSSIGTYYIFDEHNIFDMRYSNFYYSWDEFECIVNQEILSTLLIEDNWIVEELVFDYHNQIPARDLKFYTFYGHIGLIHETLNYPVRQNAFFNNDFTSASCGYESLKTFDSASTLTDKNILTKADVDCVKYISEQLPIPFIRIDFLYTNNRMVFCEFCGAPGMSHTINEKYNRYLGKLYHDAEIRLTNDLLEGKKFILYHKFIDNIVTI